MVAGAPQVHQDLQGRRDLPAPQGRPDLQGPRVPLVQRVLRARKDRKDHQVQLARKVHLARLAHKVRQARQVLLAQRVRACQWAAQPVRY